jgi:ankyrin repeat protein
LLQFVDPNVLNGNEMMSVDPLHHLADLADPFDISTRENHIILAKQLIEHGANVNAVAIPNGKPPLHNACHWVNVTNLDLVQFLLEAGADPNSQDHQGLTPLMHSLTNAPGAAKCLLNWPTMDADSTAQSGESFLVWVVRTVEYFSDKVVECDNPDRVQDQLLLRQWREIEEMLVERGAPDTGITTLE